MTDEEFARLVDDLTDDIASNALDPKVPFQTYQPPTAPDYTQRAAWARRMMWDGWYGLTAEDRVLHAGAFNWAYTLGAGLMDPWAAGATALVYAGPPGRAVWPALAR